MLQFFYHIFLPTDAQWSDIQADYSKIGDSLKSHIPFVSEFSEQLKKAQETVNNSDFLVIKMPSFSYSGSGGIGVNTSEQKVINVGEAYEPFREYVRGALFLIVVGLGFVYLIKHTLNFRDNYNGGGDNK